MNKLPWQLMSGLLALLLFYYASVQIPLAGLLVTVMLPLPILLTIDRTGYAGGLLVAAVAVAVVFYQRLVTGLELEILPLVQMILLALALAALASQSRPPELVIGGAGFLGMLFQMGVFAFQAQQQGLSPLAHLEQTITAAWSSLAEVLDKEQAWEKDLAALGLKPAEMVSLAARLSPALLLMNNSLVAWINYLLCRSLGTQSRWRQPQVPLPCWEAPGWLVFIFIGAGFLLLFPWQVLQITALNVLLVCLLVYFFQGLAIIAFNFQRFRVPRFLRASIYLLLILIKPAMLVVTIMGLVDLWLDFRRLHQPPSEA